MVGRGVELGGNGSEGIKGLENYKYTGFRRGVWHTPLSKFNISMRYQGERRSPQQNKWYFGKDHVPKRPRHPPVGATRWVALLLPQPAYRTLASPPGRPYDLVARFVPQRKRTIQ